MAADLILLEYAIVLEKSDGTSFIPVADVLASANASNASALESIAHEIVERDRALKEAACRCWLENGRALLKAKELTGHGQFESWCRSELGYSKSKAEKLMRAASVLGPYFKSVRVTDLPAPTLAYTLSASSVSDEIRNEFVPRIIAGERVMADLKRAIADHQCRLEECNNVEWEESPQSEPMSKSAKDFLDFMEDCLGDNLPRMMEIVANAGDGAIFNSRIEDALRIKALQRESAQQTQLDSYSSNDVVGRERVDGSGCMTTDRLNSANSQAIGIVKSSNSDIVQLTADGMHENEPSEYSKIRNVKVKDGKLDPWNKHLADRRAKRAQRRG